MAKSAQPPAGWQFVDENVTYDGFMEREFTTITYANSAGDTMLRIRDVQKPNKFGGWGYLVWTAGTVHRELGLVSDLDEAKEIASEYMHNTEPDNRQTA